MQLKLCKHPVLKIKQSEYQRLIKEGVLSEIISIGLKQTLAIKVALSSESFFQCIDGQFMIGLTKEQAMHSDCLSKKGLEIALGNESLFSFQVDLRKERVNHVA